MSSPPVPAAPAAPAAPVATGDAAARLAHLFRIARRGGSIHPLQHLIERYRAEQRGGGAPG